MTALDAAIELARDVDLREIARRYTTLKKIAVNEFAGPCPSPSCGGRDRFSINTRKQVFNCRGCGVGGVPMRLIKLLGRLAEPIAYSLELLGQLCLPLAQSR